MNCREFGTDGKDVIMLLHGGGLSWWNYRDVACLLENEYHVVIPILDGHAGSDRHFTSIEDNASEIIDFMDKRFGGSVPFIGGLYHGEFSINHPEEYTETVRRICGGGR